MSHEFVVQRVPSSVNAVKGFAPEVTLRGVRRITEFFCCDAAGSLTSALPDLESLGQAVVLIVVDCSEPASIQDQVKQAYAQLRGHITSVFKRQLQQKDKVRYMQAVEDRLSFRRASEPAMAQLRDAIFPDQKLDKPVELPSEDVCVLPSVLVATKTDILEKLVKSYETIEDSLQNDVALDSIIPSEFRSLARRKKESVTSVVSQYLRYQALLHCSSFASSSSRVNTVAGGGDGKTPLVHPFYRGFWIFLANSVLDDSARKQKRLTDAVTNVSGCQFFPSSLVPLGVDNASFLDPFISSGGISIPTRSAGDVDPSVSQSLPDGLTVTELPVQGLHQTYLRKLQEEEELGGSVPIISTSLPTSPTGAKWDDAKMIWDTA
ncbi:hypothetical protein AGDE_10650 [Angomonas deanei]|uniref:Uncharacterized protein n=1 Tax=Angomonas deanei TaxID=59799 RepID=A0A7G2CHR1_9TRYP|nr:hypothetical protein AGDE_10650 [Angomonas deanei]CAD2219388.1 hypothetical protein, conserved [Angomonas deanei]|eukprot:EPY27670.1 hypothetical protein AGDE_10650 [Angomonas deanei]